MKEITAIIRRDKLPETKKALEDLGYPSLTIQSVGAGANRRAPCARKWIQRCLTASAQRSN